MRVVLDTNVFISGIFLTGPHQILKAWRDGRVQIMGSPFILDEYHRVGAELALQLRDVDLKAFLDLLTVRAEIVLAPTLPPVIWDDPSDDKFLEAAEGRGGRWCKVKLLCGGRRGKFALSFWTVF